MTVPMGFIIKETCERFMVSPTEIIGPSRQRHIFRARQAAMYVARVTGQNSYPAIGRMFGGRDHTTVLHAVRSVPDVMTSEPEFQEAIVAIISAVIAHQVQASEAARGGVFRHRPTRINSDSRTTLGC